MSILIKAGTSFYEIPDADLKNYKITKKQFEKAQAKSSSQVAGQSSDCNLVDLRTCCGSKKSLWASC